MPVKEQQSSETQVEQTGGETTVTERTETVREEAVEQPNGEQESAEKAEAAENKPETEKPEGEQEQDSERDNELPDWARNELHKVRQEAARYRTRLREVEAQFAGAKTAEEFEAAVADLRQANATLERELLVTKVARAHDLPSDLAARLQGSTEDELVQDAKVLARYAVQQRQPGNLRGGLDPTEDDEPFDPAEAARRARRHRY